MGLIDTPKPPSDPPGDGVHALPRSEAEVARAADVLGFVVPGPCVAGVVANLTLLASHASALLGPEPPCPR